MLTKQEIITLITTFLVLFGLGALIYTPWVQRQLGKKAKAELSADARFSGVDVKFRGQDAYLSGKIQSEDDRIAATELVKEIHKPILLRKSGQGAVRRVHSDGLEIGSVAPIATSAPNVEPGSEPFVTITAYGDKVIRVDGTVGSTGVKNQLSDALRRRYPGYRVDDKVKTTNMIRPPKQAGGVDKLPVLRTTKDSFFAAGKLDGKWQHFDGKNVLLGPTEQVLSAKFPAHDPPLDGLRALISWRNSRPKVANLPKPSNLPKMQPPRTTPKPATVRQTVPPTRVAPKPLVKPSVPKITPIAPKPPARPTVASSVNQIPTRPAVTVPPKPAIAVNPKPAVIPRPTEPRIVPSGDFKPFGTASTPVKPSPAKPPSIVDTIRNTPVAPRITTPPKPTPPPVVRTPTRPAPVTTPRVPKARSVAQIGFATGKSELSEQSKNNALRLIKGLATRHPNATFQVVGHTDDRGSAATNERISRTRAEVVRRFLISNGINASKVTANGKGESSPRADNSTEDGRAKNRRVEIIATF